MPASSAPPPRVAAVTINWNGLDDTLGCVRSLLAQSHPGLEVHVVDNGSAGGEADALAEAFGERIRLHRSRENLGFTGGNNLVLRPIVERDEADYVVLLNNDAEAEPDWVERLVAAAEAEPGVAMCASHMLFFDHPEITENAGTDLLTTGEAVPRGRGRASWRNERPGRPLGACGGAVLYRVAALREVGVFRDDFFANFEDVDLSLRALVCGWECVYVPEARVHHRLNRSIRKVRDDAFRTRSVRNLTTAYWVNMPLAVILLNAPWLVFTYAAVPVLALLLGQRDLCRILCAARGRVWRERRAILSARRALHHHRRGNPLRLWWRQRSFVWTYFRYFVDVVLLRRRRYME